MRFGSHVLACRASRAGQDELVGIPIPSGLRNEALGYLQEQGIEKRSLFGDGGRALEDPVLDGLMTVLKGLGEQ